MSQTKQNCENVERTMFMGDNLLCPDSDFPL